MKVTSFEISKKLAEIGFKGESEWYHDKGYGRLMLYEKFEADKYKDHLVPAYDLETILEALPAEIPSNDRYANFLRVDFETREIAYYSDCAISYFSDGNTEMSAPFIADDSLANTASRLLILLHEKGIIKFN